MSEIAPTMTRRRCPCSENCAGCAPFAGTIPFTSPCYRVHASAACDGCEPCIAAGANTFWRVYDGRPTPGTPAATSGSRPRPPFTSTVRTRS